MEGRVAKIDAAIIEGEENEHKKKQALQVLNRNEQVYKR
jgi:hypothetical protein